MITHIICPLFYLMSAHTHNHFKCIQLSDAQGIISTDRMVEKPPTTIILGSVIIKILR